MGIQYFYTNDLKSYKSILFGFYTQIFFTLNFITILTLLYLALYILKNIH